jgi:hypothetical protein
MSASAPIAKAQPQESRIEKQSCGEVNIGFAAHLLGVDSCEIVWLCKTGALRARCNRHGSWKIDTVFLRRYQDNPDHEQRGPGCESSAGEERRALATPGAQSGLPDYAPCPENACEAHWERRGRVVPEFRANLCRSCYSGRALPVKPDEAANLDCPLAPGRLKRGGQK